MTSRREFLAAASVSAAAALITPRRARGASLVLPVPCVTGDLGHRPPGHPPVTEDPQLRALAMRALDAARAAGAQYAEVRFTLTRTRDTNFLFSDVEHVATGVRALANGAWGLTASPSWTDAEAVRLGTQAAQQAKENRWYPDRSIALSPLSAVATGSWSTPVVRDFFTVPDDEVLDLKTAIGLYTSRPHETSMQIPGAFRRQERTIATTDGAFFTQVIHTAFTSGYMGRLIDGGHRILDSVAPTAAGYEALERLLDLDLIDRLEADAKLLSRAKGVDIGRYDVVFDGYAMASLIARTLGEPSEIDRVLGFEANAGGTSYLATAAAPTPPLGTRLLGPPFLSVRANRSMSDGAATVRWDDEGVEPDEFDLVRQGVLTDYATSRQHVHVMEDYYRAHNRPLRSHGCSGSGTAMDFPAVVTPNLVMAPSQSSASFDALVADIADGYVVKGGDWDMDQQGLTGQWNGYGAMVCRVKRGKVVDTVAGMGLLIRSPELWKHLVAVGDASTYETKGFFATKGQPDFPYAYSVSAPAARISGLAVTDIRRALSA